jgi:hypothetical protein
MRLSVRQARVWVAEWMFVVRMMIGYRYVVRPDHTREAAAQLPIMHCVQDLTNPPKVAVNI